MRRADLELIIGIIGAMFVFCIGMVVGSRVVAPNNVNNKAYTQACHSLGGQVVDDTDKGRLCVKPVGR